MRIPSRLRTIFVCSMLEFAVLFGLPMRPEEIEKLMRTMNRPTLAHVLPKANAATAKRPTTDHQPLTASRMCHAQTDGRELWNV